MQGDKSFHNWLHLDASVIVRHRHCRVFVIIMLKMEVVSLVVYLALTNGISLFFGSQNLGMTPISAVSPQKHSLLWH